MQKIFIILIMAFLIFGQQGGYPGINTINDLDDVKITDPDSGNVIIFDGKKWVADTISGGGSGGSSLWEQSDTFLYPIGYDSVKVGIGTTTPQHKLHVDGNIAVDTIFFSGGDTLTGSSGGGTVEPKWKTFTASRVDDGRIYSDSLELLLGGIKGIIRHRFDSDSVWRYSLVDYIVFDTCLVFGFPTTTTNSGEFQYATSMSDVVRYSELFFDGVYCDSLTDYVLNDKYQKLGGFKQFFGAKAYLVHVFFSHVTSGTAPEINVSSDFGDILSSNITANMFGGTEFMTENYEINYFDGIDLAIKNKGSGIAENLYMRLVWVVVDPQDEE